MQQIHILLEQNNLVKTNLVRLAAYMLLGSQR